MLRILLVDDEIFVRKSLKEAIESFSEDFLIVGEAVNGIQALNFLEDNEVDVILTDIAMPVMDGMEFIRRVRERNSLVKIVILSCLTEFEYAKKALSLRVDDYFLKVEAGPEELIDKLSWIEQELDAERQNARTMETLLREHDNNLQRIHRVFFESLLTEAAKSEDALKKSADAIGIKLKPQNLFIVHAEMDNSHAIYLSLSAEEITAIDSSFQNILHSSIDAEIMIYVLRKSNGQYVVLFSRSNGRNGMEARVKLKDLLTKCFLEMFKLHQITYTAGISGPFFAFADIRIGYAEACMAFRQRFFFGKNKIMFYDEVFVRKNEPSILNNAEKNRIFENLEHGNFDAMISDLTVRFDIMLESGLSEEILRNFTVNMIMLVALKLEELQCDTVEAGVNYLSIVDSIKHLETVGELRKYFLDEIASMCEYYIADKHNATAMKSTAEKIRDYVNLNFCDNINLNSVANYFHMNHCYISLLFKKETGMYFMDYLTQCRVSEAKDLLKGGSLRVHEIGLQVGYPNAQYFTKVFKKAVGVTPSEYRHLGK